MIKSTLLQRKIKGQITMCTACNHYCTLKDWQTGKCGIRKNEKWDIKLLTYGKALSVNIDPIEKKPLFHFLPGTEIFSIGTAGCNFKCDFCQNWQMSQLKNMPQLETLGTDLTPQQIIQECLNNNILSIAYTYNEPTVFFEYAFDTMKLAKKSNIKNVFVSNWFMSHELWSYCKDYLDAINIDLKWYSEDFYKNICWGSLKAVKKNIEFVIWQSNIWLEITTLIIPWENDDDKSLNNIANYLYELDPNIPWHISAFHPSYRMPDKSNTPVHTLIKAYNIWKQVWLKYIYLWNVATDWYENTYCPECENTIIQRNYFSSQNNMITPWECSNCWYKLAWIWK